MQDKYLHSFLPKLNKETKHPSLFSSHDQETCPNILDIIYFRNFVQRLTFQSGKKPEMQLLRPDINFRLMRIQNTGIKARSTELMLQLLNKKKAAFGSPSFGYLTMDFSKKIIPFKYNDPERFDYPLCGLWLYGIKYNENLFENSKYIKQILWGLMTNLLMNPKFKVRLSMNQKKCSILFVLFAKGENPKNFVIEKLNSNLVKPGKLTLKRCKIKFSEDLMAKAKGNWISVNYEREIERNLDRSKNLKKTGFPLKTMTEMSISDKASPFCIYNGNKIPEKDVNLMSRSNPEKQDFLFSSSNCEKCLKNTSMTSAKGIKEVSNKIFKVPKKCTHFQPNNMTSNSSQREVIRSLQKYKNVNSNSLNLVDSCNSKTYKESDFSDRERYLIQNLEKQMELTNRNDKYYKGMIEKMQTQIDMLTKCLFNINTSLSRISDNPSMRDQDESSYFPGLSVFDVQTPNYKHQKNMGQENLDSFHILKPDGQGLKENKEGFFSGSQLKEGENQTIEILDQTRTEKFLSSENKENTNLQNQQDPSMNRNFKKVLSGLTESVEKKKDEGKKDDCLKAPHEKLKETEDMTISLSEDKSLNTFGNSTKIANLSENDEEKEKDLEKEKPSYLKIIEENRKKTEAGEGNSNNFSIQVPKISDKYKHMLDEEFWDGPNEE